MTFNGGSPLNGGNPIPVADLGHLIYTPPAAARQRQQLRHVHVPVQDSGGTANGGVDLDATPNTMTINVTAVNDAPVNTVPGAQTANEDISLPIPGLSIADVDAGTTRSR